MFIIDNAIALIDKNPLGTGAGFGVPFELNREMTTKELGFKKVLFNPMYAQHSRGKMIQAIIDALSQVLFDCNKLASDLILFSMPEFGFFTLPDELCTGSSLMPQKKNPDVLELVRAGYHEVVGYGMTVKGISANLISGYNRDMQLTTGPLFKSFKKAHAVTSILALVLSKVSVNKDACSRAMTYELFATQKVHDLVKKGMPFRDAYKKVAKDFHGEWY